MQRTTMGCSSPCARMLSARSLMSLSVGRGFRGDGRMSATGTSYARRSWTAGTLRATSRTAASETGALDERGTLQDLLDHGSHWGVWVAIQTERRQAGEIADRREHRHAPLFGQLVE